MGLSISSLPYTVVSGFLQTEKLLSLQGLAKQN